MVEVLTAMRGYVVDTRPEQHEVDGVALYLQAAVELRGSDFFQEEHCKLHILAHPGEVIGLDLADPAVRDAVLPAFRRIWMNDEPSHYFKVAKTIKRYFVEHRQIVDALVHQFQNIGERFWPMPPMPD